MCDKSSFQDVPVKKPDELYAEYQKKKKQRETREMQFIEETMR